MTRPSIPVPPGLLAYLDGALESGARMRPEHICGVLDWLHAVLVMNVDSHVELSVDELVLIANALGDAIGAPIREIGTDHVRDVLKVLRKDATPVLVMPADKDIPTETLIAAARASGAEVIVGDATSLELDEDLCPGPGNLHPHHDGPGAPEYYCAACSAQIEEH